MRPDDRQLAALIATAFDRLPAPDAARLQVLEARLVRQAVRVARPAKSRRAYWWLIVGLAASGAAAWWAGEYFAGAYSGRDASQAAPLVPAGRPVLGGGAESAPEDKDKATNAGASRRAEDPRAIYRRERY